METVNPVFGTLEKSSCGFFIEAFLKVSVEYFCWIATLSNGILYLGLNRSEERRLLADLTTMSLPDTASAMIAGRMVRDDVLAASGHPLEALIDVTKVYEASIKVIAAK